MGIAYATLQRHLHASPEFRAASTRAQPVFLSQNCHSLHALATGTATETRIFYLHDPKTGKDYQEREIRQLAPSEKAIAMENAVLDPEHWTPRQNLAISGGDLGAAIDTAREENRE